MSAPVTCGECRAPMVLRTAQRGPGAGRLFYGCSRYPACRSTHGAHPDGRPLGVPGDAATKAARVAAHAAFDRLWKEGHVPSRAAAYAWLRAAMGLSREEGHIARFDPARCTELVARVALSLASEAGAPEPLVELRRLAVEALARHRGRGSAWVLDALGSPWVEPRVLLEDDLRLLLATEPARGD